LITSPPLVHTGWRAKVKPAPDREACTAEMQSALSSGLRPRAHSGYPFRW